MAEGVLNMSFSNDIILNVFSIILLIILYIESIKHSVQASLHYKLYMHMLQVTIIMLVVDIFSRFDGNPGTIYPWINQTGNFLIFMLSPVLPSIWLLYSHYEVFQNEDKTRRFAIMLYAVIAANFVLLVISQFTGWFYYIDSGNVYHRGPFFLMSAFFNVALIFASLVLITVNRKKIEKKHYSTLVFFAVPPMVGIVLQILLYGWSLMLNSLVLSLLMVFLNIQNHSIQTDYLTGVFNRKKFEACLNAKINSSSKRKTFSAILLDMDNFKAINDTYGHEMGDGALQLCVKLLRKSLKSKDFIARYGGDEFYIILDISNLAALEGIIARINDCIEDYNESGAQPYNLGFSIGYEVYDYNSGMKAEDFKKLLDKKMYENKQATKAKERNYALEAVSDKCENE
jgi:diguanylate cyclase (GGDEF)-like protein